MSVLSRIRQNISLVAIIIFVALLAFVLPDFIKGLSSGVTGPPVAGEIAGEPISWEEYQDEVSNTLQQQRQNGPVDPVQEGQVRDQVWSSMVMRRLYEKEFEKIGIEVTKKELTEMFVGRHVDPTYLQAPIFKDSTGRFNPQRVQQWYQYMAENNPEVIIAEEDRIDLNRSYQKYINMLQGAFSTPDEMARAMYKRRNKKVDISYLNVPFNSVADSLVRVSEGDLLTYMKENSHRYEQEEQTLIRYSKFPIVPSARDSMNAFRSVNKLRERFAATERDSSFTQSRSVQPYSENFLPLSRVPIQVRDSMQGASPKSVFGPYLIGDSYGLFKVVQTREAEEAYSKVSHILVSFGKDTTEAENKAQDLLREARSGDFAEVASNNSDDFGSRQKGGELGWYPQGQFGEEFDEAVSNASVGSIIGPIKGRGGFHIVKILDRTNTEYDIAQIQDAVIYSTSTRDSVYGLANRFAKELFESQDINAAASKLNVVAYESSPLTDQSRSIQGLTGGRELIIWALNRKVKEYTQKVFRVEDDYVLAQVIKKSSEGLKPLDEVRAEVERKVLNEKKGEYLAERMRQLSGSDLEAMKNEYGQGARSGSSVGLTFTTNAVTGLGIEPKVVGKAFGMEEGQISGPIIGSNGVQIIKVTKVTEASEPDPAAIASLKTQLQSNLQRAVLQQTDNFTRQTRLEKTLRDLYKVEDQRAKAQARNYGY